MPILGIETSCDETAAAVIDLDGTVLGHTVASQTDVHQEWGGVVPSLAARAHLDNIRPIVEKTLKDANCKPNDLHAIGVTAGPGLIASLITGVMFAKGMAITLAKPFIAINHLEGHGLLPHLNPGVQCPYLLLLVSGGHSQFILMNALGNYTLLGQSLDDAAGETFDKTARLLGLPYPGGPALEALAQTGNPDRFPFPIPLKGRAGCDFSFSGLKTAVAKTVQDLSERIDPQTKADVAASFQKTIGLIFENRLKNAVSKARALSPNVKALVVSGGVAANRYIRTVLKNACAQKQLQFIAPPLDLCTDNGVMIAYASLLRYKAGLLSPLDFEPRARWPLSEVTASPTTDVSLKRT
jgi:N6-L-threonylcarbamoyladenine synthase